MRDSQHDDEARKNDSWICDFFLQDFDDFGMAHEFFEEIMFFFFFKLDEPERKEHHKRENRHFLVEIIIALVNISEDIIPKTSACEEIKPDFQVGGEEIEDDDYGGDNRDDVQGDDVVAKVGSDSVFENAASFSVASSFAVYDGLVIEGIDDERDGAKHRETDRQETEEKGEEFFREGFFGE